MGHQMLYGAAASYELDHRVELMLELYGRSGLRQFSDFYTDVNPFEVDVAARWGVTSMVSVLAGARVLRHHLGQEELLRPAAMLVLVLLSQVPLGGLAVLTNGHPAVSTLHAFAVTAALGAALVLALRSFRDPLPGRPGGAAVPAGATAAGRTGVAQ
jgi:hypothetical protein